MRLQLKRRGGFTLIEALGAFAILAITLAQLLKGVSGGVRNEARADFLLRASRQAGSQIDALGVDGAIPFGESRGRYSDGLEWILSISPGPSTTIVGGSTIIKSFRIWLIITKPSGYGERFALSTVKLKIDQNRSSP